MATIAAKRQSFVVEPESLEAILPQASPQIMASPVEDAGIPSSPKTVYPMSPPPRPGFSHSRSMSLASAASRGKRLSLSFPVQPMNVGFIRDYPATSMPSMADVISPGSRVDSPVPSPPAPGNFLVALAAQERRVLELKEELYNAEDDLERLKRQWSIHESSRKRSDPRRGAPLQPLDTHLNSVENGGESSAESTRLSRELERQKSLTNGSKNPRRKVIPGQRHKRELSLLSPERANILVSPTTYDSNNSENSADQREEGAKNLKPRPVSISSTLRDPQLVPQKDALLRTGKQMAADFKEGIWTFIEDLRQATVGDEAINGTVSRSSSNLSTPKGARKKGSKNSLKGSGKSPNRRSPGGALGSLIPNGKVDTRPETLDSNAAFWKENGAEEKTIKEKSPQEPARQTEEYGYGDESWGIWDSPVSKGASPRWSTSTFVSEGGGSPPTSEGSPRTSKDPSLPPRKMPLKNSATPKREDLPWPLLKDFSPQNLKRTATTLMNEWEKSLTPPRERDRDPDRRRISRLPTASKEEMEHGLI
ncbi:MAG: hypothetical protein M1829_005676 [Trizodia sp. TS-e1964]|nr:MAG: hypothetical protein M1829_005676 [Trizodia sp. TS-e1964]